MEHFKVLCVDDDPLCLVLFKWMFRKDFKVVVVGSANEAIVALSEDPSIKVVVSNWMKCGMNGVDLILFVNNTYPGKTCFMLSSCADCSEIEPYVRLGAIKRYFQKPLDKTLFLQEMKKISGHSNALANGEERVSIKSGEAAQQK